MSTRCHIIVEDQKYDERTILYRHSDGYPDGKHGVLATLVPFVARFIKHRGFDACYMGAQIMCDQINQARSYSRAYRKERLKKLYADGYSRNHRLAKLAREDIKNVDNDFLGFGISSEIHGDVEFIYRVTREGIHVEYPNGEKLTTDAEAAAMLTGEIPEGFREVVEVTVVDTPADPGSLAYLNR